MKELAQRGCVGDAFDGKEKLGIFFVTKSGKLRIVVDCRRSNCSFRPSASVQLAAGDRLAGLELSDDKVLTVGSADLAVSFYHLGLPDKLRR